MDIRIEKTKTAIHNTFLELRSKKPLEKITIKELCEKAQINKSTFYSHYKDIYDLSDQLETDVVASVIEAIPNPQNCLEVEYQLKKILFDAHPEYKQDPSVNVVLSYTVYGGYYAFFENRQYGDATVVDIISQISSEAMNLL